MSAASIEFPILGFLADSPRSGYDLKKLFAASDLLYWSGNNNQVYTALLDLHARGLVSQDIDYRKTGPARKQYTITESGREALHTWLLAPPEPPSVRSPFLVQLLWSSELADAELDEQLVTYERDLRFHAALIRNQLERLSAPERGSGRSALIRRSVYERLASIYESESEWATSLRLALAGP